MDRFQLDRQAFSIEIGAHRAIVGRAAARCGQALIIGLAIAFPIISGADPILSRRWHRLAPRRMAALILAPAASKPVCASISERHTARPDDDHRRDAGQFADDRSAHDLGVGA
jgi:hypothetical protein